MRRSAYVVYIFTVVLVTCLDLFVNFLQIMKFIAFASVYWTKINHSLKLLNLDNREVEGRASRFLLTIMRVT